MVDCRVRLNSNFKNYTIYVKNMIFGNVFSMYTSFSSLLRLKQKR